MITCRTSSAKILVEPDSGIKLPNPYGCIQGGVLTVEPWEIFAAIVTCGCVQMDYLPQKLHSKIEEIIFKRALVDYALKEDNGYVVWDEKNLSELDETERNFVSYYVGMIFANLVARKIYEIDFLCHFKKFMDRTNSVKIRNGKALKANQTEPDFVGIKYNQMVVEFFIFEAKGGKNKTLANYNKAMNKQLTAVGTIIGHKPKGRILCYTICSKKGNPGVANNLLKVIVAKTAKISPKAYDIENSVSNVNGLFRSEMMQLSEEMGAMINKSKEKKVYVKDFGKFYQEADGNTIVWVINYSEHDAIEIRFNNGDDIQIIRYKKMVEIVTSEEKMTIERK